MFRLLPVCPDKPVHRMCLSPRATRRPAQIQARIKSRQDTNCCCSITGYDVRGVNGLTQHTNSTSNIAGQRNAQLSGEPGENLVKQQSFWSYLRQREINEVPRGSLRWWLLGLIILGWAVEQYEALKNGPVLVYILEDFDKTLVQWGYAAAAFGLIYSLGAMVLSRAGDRFGRRPLMIWPVFA